MLVKEDIMGRPLHDRNGRVIGKVAAIYRYPAELNAAWGLAAVTRRRLIVTTVTNLVDLRDAVLQDGAVVAAYPSEVINAAPDYQPLIGNVLADRDAADVLAHYGVEATPV